MRYISKNVHYFTKSFFTVKSTMTTCLQNVFSAIKPEMLLKDRKPWICRTLNQQILLCDSIFAYFSTLCSSKTLIWRKICRKTVAVKFRNFHSLIGLHGVKFFCNAITAWIFPVKPTFCILQMSRWLHEIISMIFSLWIFLSTTSHFRNPKIVVRFETYVRLG